MAPRVGLAPGSFSNEFRVERFAYYCLLHQRLRAVLVTGDEPGCGEC